MAQVQTAPELQIGPKLTEAESQEGLLSIALATLGFANPFRRVASRDLVINPQAKIFTLAEVAEHDSYNDCWVIIYDRVYDITDFMFEHPGGSDILLECAGQDASTAFRSSGHSQGALIGLDRFLIGELPMHERLYRKPGGMRLSDIPD